MTHTGGVVELMPKNTLEISKLQKTISQFKECYIENEQFHIRFHLDRKEQSIVKIEISGSLGKKKIVTITFWYVEAERKLSQCISLYTWHLSGTRGTLACFSWINRSLIGLARHTATLERCFIFQQVGKKSKLREGNKLERAEKKKKKTREL